MKIRNNEEEQQKKNNNNIANKWDNYKGSKKEGEREEEGPGTRSEITIDVLTHLGAL